MHKKMNDVKKLINNLNKNKTNEISQTSEKKAIMAVLDIFAGLIALIIGLSIANIVLTSKLKTEVIESKFEKDTQTNGY